MTERDGGAHAWPEAQEEVATSAPRAGRLRRLGRVLGDVFLTAGLSKGFTGSDRAGESAPITNLAVFGEGEAKGREATRGHTHD